MRVLNSHNTSLSELIKAIKGQNGKIPPVENWEPEYCGQMDMVIKKDGSWWHEGSPIARPALIKLFSTVLRKDHDGQTYLVTPAEKIQIQVECAPFLAVGLAIKGRGPTQRLFLTTNVGEIVEVGENHPLWVKTDKKTGEPTPLLRVRGRLDALITRSVFYELVEMAQEIITKNGPQLGVYANETFYPLGPIGFHNV